MISYYALLDCNNFYASCERVFNPKLIGRPVVVLSNNDGCVIARSNESKKLGVPMGMPFFKCRDLIKQHNMAVYSSNFTLYGDFSDRVMSIVRSSVPDVEIYSIDEAFFILSGMRPESIEQSALALRKKVKQWTGIPVSIGIGSSKTLAKAANWWAKRHPEWNGVYMLETEEKRIELLRQMPVNAVWGVGRRYDKKLDRYRIRTAYDLARQKDAFIRKHMTIVGLKTAWELRGKPCLTLEQIPPAKQTILCSRTFAQKVSRQERLAEAVAYYITRAAEKLRKQESRANCVSVFLETDRFNKNQPRYAPYATHTLEIPSSCTVELIRAAKKVLERIYLPDQQYKRAGIMLSGIVGKSEQQLTIDKQIISSTECDTTMKTVDSINKRWGRDTVNFAAVGNNQVYKAKQNLKSQRFTTEWNELLKINV